MDDLLFRTPPDECRGTDFWMLNDGLNECELRRQLRSMREQGVASVIARTYIGLKSDYPGPSFMAHMRAVVDEARALGMKLYMQAGYMPEAVMGLPPEYSLGDVRACPPGQGEGIPMDSFGGVEYRLSPSMRILDMLSREATDFYIRQSYEEMWKEFRGEFGKTIVSMWVDEPSFRRASLPWTKGLPAEYERLFGEPFPMDMVHALFVDCEGAEKLRLRYWRTVLSLMKNAYFASVRDWCHQNGLQFSGHLMAEDTMESQIAATCFTMPFYKFFDVPGIDYLTAHMNWHDGSIKPERPDWENGWLAADILTPLQCSSAAHQAGKRAVLAEMYGVSTENLNLRDQKHMFDAFAVLGINHRSVHGFFYSLRGRGKRAYPPHLGAYQPYFSRYRVLTDALARESYFIRQGRPARDVLVLHPIESAFMEFHAGDGKNPALKRRDRAFLETVYALTAGQVNFELGDEDTLAEWGAIRPDGLLEAGEMAYATVVLPGMRTVRRRTLDLLRALAAEGGRVLALGARPALVDGEACGDMAFMEVVPDLRALSETLNGCPRAFSYNPVGDGTQVRTFWREDGTDRLIYLFNADCAEGRRGEIEVPGDWAALSYRAEDGQIEPLHARHRGDATRVPVSLEPGGSAMIRLVRGESVTIKRERINPAVMRETTVRLSDHWKAKRLDPNVLVMEMFCFARGDARLSVQAYPILAIQDILSREGYRGELTLQCTFETRIPISGARLAIESPRNQRISLDGAQVSSEPEGFFTAQAFETVHLPNILPGEHTLELRRHFEPLGKPTMAVTSLFENLGGVELEPAYLIGDFAVSAMTESGIGDLNCIRLNPRMVLACESGFTSGELSAEGYPFYAGAFALAQGFSLSESDAADRVRLRLDTLHAGAADVRVNGVSCGSLAWHPYEVDLTRAVRPGENELEITLYGTLRNLLGPWHRPAGEIGACWGGYEYPDLPWLGAVESGRVVEHWYEDRVPDREGWTERYLVLPMGLAGARLVLG